MASKQTSKSEAKQSGKPCELLTEVLDEMENLSSFGTSNLPVSRAGGSSEVQSKNLGADCLSVQLLVERLDDKESIINGISDTLMLLNARSYKILDVNKAFLNSYRLRYDEIFGKTCHEVTHHQSMPCSQLVSGLTCPLEKCLSTGNLCRVEHVHKDKEGKNLYFEITAYPLKNADGQVDRIIHLSRDVTDRRLAEEALKESSEKTKLLAYSVAHDLKSPAIGIHGLTQRLLDHYAESLDEKGKNDCLQILRASQQLVALTENINAFISAKETLPTFENFRLKEILGAVKEEFAAQLDARHIRWSEPDHDPEISADKLSITRMLRNLVDNALKYGGNGLSEITVGHEVSDEFHFISVTDDGAGIGNEEFGEIFDPFKRTHISKGIEGTGLGLAIVKEIANQHKGKVWSEPGREKGTTFCVTISRELGVAKSREKEKPGNHNAIT